VSVLLNALMARIAKPANPFATVASQPGSSSNDVSTNHREPPPPAPRSSAPESNASARRLMLMGDIARAGASIDVRVREARPTRSRNASRSISEFANKSREQPKSNQPIESPKGEAV
jgi:hypothetical protein